MIIEAPYPGSYAIPSATPRVGHPFPQPALPTNEAERYIQWRPETVDKLRLTGTISEISNTVYERLLSRPGLPTSEGDRVFTLPVDDGAEAIFLAGNESNIQGSSIPLSVLGALALRNSVDGKTREPRGALNADNAVVRKTDRYLAELQLPRLTDAEAARLTEHISNVHVDLPAGLERNIPDESPDGHPRIGTSDPRTASGADTSSAFHRRRRINASSSSATGLGVLEILALLGRTSLLGHTINTTFRELRSAPEEALTLA